MRGSFPVLEFFFSRVHCQLLWVIPDPSRNGMLRWLTWSIRSREFRPLSALSFLQLDGFQKSAMEMVKPQHGTTTLGFVFQHGVIIAVDSRATMGAYIGKKDLGVFGMAPGLMICTNEAWQRSTANSLSFVKRAYFMVFLYSCRVPHMISNSGLEYTCQCVSCLTWFALRDLLFASSLSDCEEGD